MSLSKEIAALAERHRFGERERRWQGSVAKWKRDYASHLLGFHPGLLPQARNQPTVYAPDCGICMRLSAWELKNLAEGVEVAGIKRRMNLH